jgi:hypothetical protein
MRLTAYFKSRHPSVLLDKGSSKRRENIYPKSGLYDLSPIDTLDY